jgi:hypothetical protein
MADGESVHGSPFLPSENHPFDHFVISSSLEVDDKSI